MFIAQILALLIVYLLVRWAYARNKSGNNK